MTQNIIDQTSNAMDILECHFPNEDHVMVFDIAIIHLKHADDTLSACKMPNFPPGMETNGMEVTEVKVSS
jgi:hypothetical protein